MKDILLLIIVSSIVFSVIKVLIIKYNINKKLKNEVKLLKKFKFKIQKLLENLQYFTFLLISFTFLWQNKKKNDDYI